MPKIKKSVILFGLSKLLGRSLYKKIKEKDYLIKGFSLRKKEWFKEEFYFFEDFFNKNFEADFYIYLSAVSGEFQVERDYINALEVNVITPLKILNRIKNGHFIYISSASVYENKLFPEEEEANFHNSLYGSMKFAAEGLLKTLSTKKNIKFTSLRFPRIYGPFMERNPVSDFLKALREKKKEVVLYDDYSSRYEYIFSYDAAEYILKVMGLGLEGIYNCGSGIVKSVLEIKNIFEKITGENFNINFKDKRKGVDTLNSEKIKKFLKIEFTDFEEGIKIILKEENIIF
ncbi:MAG: NAD(P)-dependent oxidoreductase [candidate division WOR-3 bacterium]